MAETAFQKDISVFSSSLFFRSQSSIEEGLDWSSFKRCGLIRPHDGMYTYALSFIHIVELMKGYP